MVFNKCFPEDKIPKIQINDAKLFENTLERKVVNTLEGQMGDRQQITPEELSTNLDTIKENINGSISKEITGEYDERIIASGTIVDILKIIGDKIIAENEQLNKEKAKRERLIIRKEAADEKFVMPNNNTLEFMGNAETNHLDLQKSHIILFIEKILEIKLFIEEKIESIQEESNTTNITKEKIDKINEIKKLQSLFEILEIADTDFDKLKQLTEEGITQVYKDIKNIIIDLCILSFEDSRKDNLRKAFNKSSLEKLINYLYNEIRRQKETTQMSEEELIAKLRQIEATKMSMRKLKAI